MSDFPFLARSRGVRAVSGEDASFLRKGRVSESTNERVGWGVRGANEVSTSMIRAGNEVTREP
ncbi:hypothetical protein [Halostagnicola bangensis]